MNYEIKKNEKWCLYPLFMIVSERNSRTFIFSLSLDLPYCALSLSRSLCCCVFFLFLTFWLYFWYLFFCIVDCTSLCICVRICDCFWLTRYLKCLYKPSIRCTIRVCVCLCMRACIPSNTFDGYGTISCVIVCVQYLFFAWYYCCCYRCSLLITVEIKEKE